MDTFTVNEIFPALQGEGPTIGLPVVFVRFFGCNLSCPWCFTKGTKILTTDLNWKDISEVKIGEYVYGFDEVTNKLVKTKIISVMVREADVVKVKFKSGKELGVTEEHPFYYHSKRTKPIKKLINSSVRTIAQGISLVNKSDDWFKGWLAGMIEGDGCIWILKRQDTKRIRLYLKDKVLLKYFKKVANRFGYNFYYGNHNKLKSYNSEIVKALWLTTDAFVEKFEREILDKENIDSWSKDRYRGWIAGMVDAEGVKKNTSRICQKNEFIRKKIKKILTILDIEFKEEDERIRMTNRTQLQNLLEFKFFSKVARDNILNMWIRGSDEVESLQKNGVDVVYNIETESHNYIAEGFLVHNCDSEYAWKKGVAEESDHTKMTDEEIIEKIIHYKNTLDIDTVVFTGGEPTLQLNGDKGEFLMDFLCEQHFKVEIETNGIGLQKLYDFVQYNHSPKFYAGEEHDWKDVYLRKNAKILGKMYTNNSHCVKFVLESGEKREECIKFIKEYEKFFRLNKSEIFIMSEGMTQSKQLKAMPDDIEFSLKNCYNYVPRMHIIAFDTQRRK